MFNIKQYRAKAVEYGARSREATDPSQVREAFPDKVLALSREFAEACGE